MSGAEAIVGAEIPCGLPGLTCSSWVGWLTVAMSFVIFVGSVYLILAAVVGRWMGYLVLSVGFWGWMILLSALWLFGFWSQGLDTPTNLGPRGTEPGWVVVDTGVDLTSPTYPVIDEFPNDPWREGEAGDDEAELNSAVQEFLAEEATAELEAEGIEEEIEPTEFTVSDVRFTEVDGTRLAAGRAAFSGGGPEVEFVSVFSGGSVPKFSYLFLFVSVVAFVVHLPLLDRAERKRKAVLTGGTAPPWRGPA